MQGQPYNLIRADTIPFGSSQQNQNQQSNTSNQAGSLFGDATAATSQPQQGGGLFGSSTTQTAQPAQAGGSFSGFGQTSQSQNSGGMFGSTATAQPQPGGGLFGSTATSQPQQGGGLFGSAAAPQGGGGFGSTTGQGGGLLGNAQSQPQQQQSSGLFGSTRMPAAQPPGGGGLFSNPGQSTQQPQQSNSVFGNTQGASLFGGNQSGTQSFGGSTFVNSQQQPPAANSIFGMNAVPASQLNAPSMLRASQYRQIQAAPFLGKLSMGQGTSMGQKTAPPPAPVGAVKINYDELRPTTRFQDCVDEVKTQFEQAEKMIQRQEEFCQQIQAILSKHGDDVNSITPDVELVKDKADATEQALASNAQTIETHRKVAETDRKDFDRCQRVIENLRLPAGYQVPNVTLSYGSVYSSAVRRPGQPATTSGDASTTEDYDTDVIENYFLPMASNMQRTLDTYASNLAEIESHMKVIENSAFAQAQQLAAKRAGATGSGQANGDDTVRDLADTLRGFEQSILGVAGVVGQCREGVNELVLGRLAGGVGASARTTGSPWW